MEEMIECFTPVKILFNGEWLTKCKRINLSKAKNPSNKILILIIKLLHHLKINQINYKKCQGVWKR